MEKKAFIGLGIALFLTSLAHVSLLLSFLLNTFFTENFTFCLLLKVFHCIPTDTVRSLSDLNTCKVRWKTD